MFPHLALVAAGRNSGLAIKLFREYHAVDADGCFNSMVLNRVTLPLTGEIRNAFAKFTQTGQLGLVVSTTKPKTGFTKTTVLHF